MKILIMFFLIFSCTTKQSANDYAIEVMQPSFLKENGTSGKNIDFKKTGKTNVYKRK
jgi:hypothetical protein